jgi:hypothetical protein
LFKRKGYKNGYRNWKNKKKRKNPSLPLAGLNPARGRFPLPRPRLPPPQPTYRPTPRSRPRTLTRRPHLSAPPPRPHSRSLPLADWPHPSVTSSSSPRTTLPRSPQTTVPNLAPSPRPSPCCTGKFGTAPSSLLDRVLARYRPRRAVSSSSLCGNYSGAVHPTGVRRAPPLPSPRAPIKGSPRALPCPAPASATPLLPRPSPVTKAPPSSSPPVSLPPLLPSPLVVQREIRMACQLRHTAVNLGRHSPTPIPARSSQAATPAAELCHLPTDSPLLAPSSQIEPAPRFASPSSC